jgi:hypothetical protein
MEEDIPFNVKKGEESEARQQAETTLACWHPVDCHSILSACGQTCDSGPACPCWLTLSDYFLDVIDLLDIALPSL